MEQFKPDLDSEYVCVIHEIVHNVQPFAYFSTAYREVLFNLKSKSQVKFVKVKIKAKIRVQSQEFRAKTHLKNVLVAGQQLTLLLVLIPGKSPRP